MNESEHSVRNIFAEALEISDSGQRSAFLDKACGVNAGLRREVEELLQAEADAGQFLPEKSAATTSRAALQGLAEAADPLGALPALVPSEKPGDRIGRYELLEKLGEGGCGVVYLAQQGTPVRRKVALKVIKLGMDTQQVIARFEAERQALAMMDHPNIAKVFDAGATDTGRSYFVMELVRGSKITDYCAQHQLATNARLELFILVCQAVQHAHQKGIIHRDLKPSNILVTVRDGVAVPKVIDFGIAKATEGKLTDQTLFTAFEQFLGTPAYMSPEQAAMTTTDVDTRSDIYSLGVLLYELLTGTTPFDTKTLLASGVDELRRTIREKEPLKPSTRLNRERAAAKEVGHVSPLRAFDLSAQDGAHGATRPTIIDSDLDWIVMKCLEKDRARRYATANGLAADLQRHLNNEPVIARPPSRLYEFQKTVRRHKVGFAATAAVIVVLIVGAIVSTWEAIRAKRAEQQAQAEKYTSEMNLVYQSWNEGNLRRAVGLLTNYFPKPGEPDLRGFEWRYLWKLCQDQSLHTVKFETDDPVWKLATSPAHSFVAAACDKTIRLLDPSTGRELDRFPYPNPNAADPWPAIALASGRTNLLAAHRAEGVVALWDVASRKLLLSFRPFTNNVGVLALSPDGNFLAATDRPRSYSTVLTVWDISLRPEPSRLAWHELFDEGHPALAFSPDGRTLAMAAYQKPEVVIETWEVTTGRKLKPTSGASTGDINAIAFSPDGTLLASSGVEGRIKIWDFTRRTLKFFFDGHVGSVTSLAFSPDGTRLISGGSDGTIRCWDIASQKEAGLWRAPGGGDLNAVFAPNGKSIVSSARGEVKIWKPEPQEEATILRVPLGWGWPIVSPDSKSLIISDPDDSQGSSVWDIVSGQHEFDLACRKGLRPQSLAFSPKGRWFASGGLEKEGLVALWDRTAWTNGAARVEPSAYLTNGFEAASICFSPDGKTLAAAGLCFPPSEPKEPSGATNRLAFWEVGSWKKLNLLPQAGAGATEWAAAATAVFSNDGRLLAVGSRDGWVRLWDFKHERLLKEFKAHDNVKWAVRVTISLDNRWLASFNEGGSSIKLFDLADLEHSRQVTLSQEEPGIYSALFDPDNKSLITASNDGLIKFWNLQTGHVALTLRHGHGPGGFLAMAPDGTFLVSKDANGIVKLWRAPSLKEIDSGRSAP